MQIPVIFRSTFTSTPPSSNLVCEKTTKKERKGNDKPQLGIFMQFFLSPFTTFTADDFSISLPHPQLTHTPFSAMYVFSFCAKKTHWKGIFALVEWAKKKGRKMSDFHSTSSLWNWYDCNLGDITRRFYGNEIAKIWWLIYVCRFSVTQKKNVRKYWAAFWDFVNIFLKFIFQEQILWLFG